MWHEKASSPLFLSRLISPVSSLSKLHSHCVLLLLSSLQFSSLSISSICIIVTALSKAYLLSCNISIPFEYLLIYLQMLSIIQVSVRV